MRVTKQLISTTNACALYNKGVSRVVVPVACNANKAREVLKKENKEKMLNYLDIPNNCVLSLSLSSRADLTNFLISCVRARGSPCTNPVNKGLLGVSFVRFFVPFCLFGKRQIRTNL